MEASRRIDADLYQPAPMPVPRQGCRTDVLATTDKTERQAAGGDHGPPFPWFASETCAKSDEPLHLCFVADFKVEVDPRSVVAYLLMDVWITVRRFEAAEFSMSAPRIAELPAERRRPEVR